MIKAAPRRGDVPCSLAAEQALLGCVLIDEWEVWGEIAEFPVEASDFFLPEHQAIWRAFRFLADSGTEVTAPSTALALAELGVIDAVDTWLGVPALPGTEPYLAELTAATFSAKGCAAFIRMVQHYSAMRAPVNANSRRMLAL